MYTRGRLIADAVSGQADPAAGTAVSSGTLFFAVSAAKGVAATLAHVLAESGELDYDLRLASIWPGFASEGKERITVRHVLAHTAGLPGLPAGTTVAQLCDWEHMCAVLAAATPWWEPGTKFGYHALTFGFLLGETLRRLTGRTISELLRDTVTGPLGLADEVCFAVPPRLLPRMARRPAGRSRAGTTPCRLPGGPGYAPSPARSVRVRQPRRRAHRRHPVAGHHDRPRRGPYVRRLARAGRRHPARLAVAPGRDVRDLLHRAGRGHGLPRAVGVRLQPGPPRRRHDPPWRRVRHDRRQRLGRLGRFGRRVRRWP